jgi:hypothetical protein
MLDSVGKDQLKGPNETIAMQVGAEQRVLSCRPQRPKRRSAPTSQLSILLYKFVIKVIRQSNTTNSFKPQAQRQSMDSGSDTAG